MPLEIELKLRLDDLQTLHRRLRQLNAEPREVLLETNTFFDWPDHSLAGSDQGLRLRVADYQDNSPTRVTLTHKGPRAPGQLKVRQETEVQVADVSTARQLLEALGLRQVLVFEKLRHVWKLGGCHVLLDTLPQLGDFLEIEGPSEPAVLAVRDQLGLRQSPPITDTYVTLLLATAGDSAQRPLVFAFPTGFPPWRPRS